MIFVLDPVCEKLILREEANVILRFRDGFYYFCSKRCSEMFENFPQNYLSEEEPAELGPDRPF